MDLPERTQNYKIVINTLIEINESEEEFTILQKFNLDNIENITIIELKELLYKKNNEYCPCKLKLINELEDGIVYSDYNDTPYKIIKECFPKKIIYFLFCDNEKCECDLEYKVLLNLTKSELINKLIETQNQLKKINLLNNELKSQIEEKDNEIDELKIKLKESEKKNNLLNKVYKKKVKEIEELNQNLKSYSERTVNNQLSKNVTSNYEKYNICEANIPITNFINNDKKNNKEYIKKHSYDFYDIIIDIKSIKDINKGWEIIMNERGKKNYNLYKEKEILRIGVIGNANKGKSFFLSKISKIELPSGTSIRTEGLSIKYPELEHYKNRKIVLLDSAGLETPILKEDNTIIDKELFKEKSREHFITELFLQNYIIHNSDILILVVGILTYSEQKLLTRIKTEIQRAKLNKPLYIIHNLKTFVEIKQVENYINNYLLKSATFDLEIGHKISTKAEQKSGIYYYEKDDKLKIFHLIFANEQSDAGKYYNNYTLEFLENSYQQVNTLKSFDIINSVKERFIKESKEIIDNNSFQSLLSIDDLLDNENILLEKKIRLKDKKKNIKLKKFYIDEIGISKIKNNDYEPFYNYYKKKNKIIVRMECPGIVENINSNVYISGKYNFIVIKGVKKKDKEPDILEDNIYNSREYGNFCIKIPFILETIKLKNKCEKVDKKNGIIILKYDIEEKNVFAREIYSVNEEI